MKRSPGSLLSRGGYRALFSRDAAARLVAGRRRATILIFAMGVLTLLALVGVGVLANVRTQRSRVARVRVGVTPAKLLDGVQQSVLERLRADLWGEPSAPGGYLTGLTTVAPGGARESNEPFDAPGPFDRWLSSTVPYRFDPQPVVANDEYLVWPHVSYLGSDLLQTSGLYNWPDNSRTAILNDPTDFNTGATNDSKLTNVPVAITPPVSYNPPYYPFGANPQPGMIPGATTNVTIEVARRVWQSLPAAWRDMHRFPYFDTDQDGIVDLYDADGDGVPDSPISFALPYSGTKNDEPREVYAVVRIVDNSSMLNLSTSGSRDTDGDGLGDGSDLGDLFFALGSDPDRQLRGRRVWETCVDAPANSTALGLELAPLLDGDRGATLGQLINYRFTGNLFTAPSFGTNNFYSDVVRRLLAGGANRSGDSYGRFRAPDELALHNRNGLCNYVGGGTGARTDLENAIPETLGGAGGAPGRWVRFSVNNPYGPFGYIALLDTENVVNRAAIFGTDSSGNAVPALRRPLLTTVSRVCDRMPESTATTTFNNLSTDGVGIQARQMPYGPSGTGMPEKIDLNTPVNEAVAAARAEYLGWLIWAFDRSGTASDGLQVMSDPGASGALTVIPRVRLATQLAANVVDFRDSDDTPTVIEDAGGGNPVVGLERQPFINETYAHVRKVRIDPTTVDVSSQFAVEIVNPYPVAMAGYKLKIGPNPPVSLQPIPAASASGAGRLVVTSDLWGNMQIADLPTAPTPDTPLLDVQEGTGIELCDSSSITAYPVWLLRPGVTVASVTVDWPCDRFDMTAPWAVDSGWVQTPDPVNPGDSEERWNKFQREEIASSNNAADLTWKFTVGRSHHGSVNSGSGHSLTEPNRLGIGGTPVAISDVEPAVWTFRNVGLSPANPAVRAFESPLELSRVFAYGNELAIANPNDTAQWITVPELLAKTQRATPPAGVAPVDLHRTAGRLDFAGLGVTAPFPKAGRVMNYVTCSGGQFDVDCLNGTCNPVDNDGDGTANTAGEFSRVGFRQAGLINVNTAPAAVLRAVPWMTRAESIANNGWDFGPTIVSLREKRPVQSIFGATVDMSDYLQAGQPFVTVSDISRASSIDPQPAPPNVVPPPAPASQFDLARFVQPGVPPIDNAAAPDYSPDFDRTIDGAQAASADLRARDVVLARWGNVLSTRSDVFTVYVALMDENGRYIRRSRFVVDRSNTAVEDLVSGRPTLPTVIGRSDSDYYDDMR